MTNKDESTRRIAAVLAESPMWCRLALTAQKDHLRERAAEQMAELIVHRLAEPEPAAAAQRELPGLR
jgi:hypothetical protein